MVKPWYKKKKVMSLIIGAGLGIIDEYLGLKLDPEVLERAYFAAFGIAGIEGALDLVAIVAKEFKEAYVESAKILSQPPKALPDTEGGNISETEVN